MVGNKSVDAVLTRVKARASTYGDPAERSIDAERVESCYARCRYLDPPDPVVRHDGANRFSGNSCDDNALIDPL